MIQRAGRRRMIGDWRGACAAANVDVAFDLADVAREHGEAVRTMLKSDLEYFAPDLLRWHLPRLATRYSYSPILPGREVILAGYGEADRPAAWPRLYISTPAMADGPQRLTLRFGPVHYDSAKYMDSVQNWTAARHLWDARHAGELRERCGGGGRAPFHGAFGRRRGAGELPGADPGVGDPAARTEWVTLLHDRGEAEAAFAAAGITLAAPRPYIHYYVRPLEFLAWLPLALTRLEPELRRLAADGFGYYYRLPFFSDVTIAFALGSGNESLRAAFVTRGEAGSLAVLPEACWRRLPDLDLLRHGDTTPELLHPLVSASLFPGRAPAIGDGPPGPEIPSVVRVRCRGQWHEVRPAGGRLQVPHSEEEQRRERAMRALGGAVAGCFAAQQAWTSGAGRLPKALRDQRRELLSRARHGDTPGVIRLLDAGVDPRARDGRQRTLLHLLHLLHLLDYQALLPRLLAAGLDIEATDHHKRTPLHVIAGEGGSPDLVRALLAAGARTDVVDRPDAGCHDHGELEE
jgi:hypothetical protein